MECLHGKRVWYIRGATPWAQNRIGVNCIPCWQRELRLNDPGSKGHEMARDTLAEMEAERYGLGNELVGDIRAEMQEES